MIGMIDFVAGIELLVLKEWEVQDVSHDSGPCVCREFSNWKG